ncbi:MAG: Ppx/GppA family phosphatase [Herminiimonas sp.]|nr:Ppx/GppA family phosphatase [Herminiimonas sp.]
MFAAVDLGSNSFRLHIAHHDGETIRVLKSARDPIKLAAGLDRDGNLSEAAMRLALDCLARFKTILAGYPLNGVRVVATNTIRIANNAAQFLPLAEKAIGYPIEIISGEEEGRLIYMGVASSIVAPAERRLVLDIGGGSTELILGVGQDIEQVESFSIGTALTSQNYFIGGGIDSAAFDAAILAARSMFEDAAPLFRPEHWSIAYGSSGTLRAISDAIAKNGLGDGTLTAASLKALRLRLIAFGDVSRIVLTGMKPDRAAVIVGGLSILIGVMQELEIDSMQPIEAGLRMGVLWDLYLRATKRDRREQSVRGFMHRFHVDDARAERVADYAGRLLTMLKPVDESLARHLHWSALLHEVGLAVSHSGYHKHGAYLIENADLSGFTTREQRTMATLIVAQKGNLRKVGDALVNPDVARAILALRMAVLFSHARLTLDGAEMRLKMKKGIELELHGDWVAQHPTVAFWMQKERDYWHEAGIDFTIRAA